MSVRDVAKSATYTLREKGFGETFRIAKQYVGHHVFDSHEDPTTHRYRLSQRLAATLNSTVAYGPFTGLKLDTNSWWGAADRGSMLLGLYESEVLSWMDSARAGRSILIDLGAADGYYAIGALKAGWVKHAYCFEMSEAGRTAIQQNADANGVGSRVTILGTATSSFVDELVRNHGVDISQCLVLIDIEGAEFEVLAPSTISALAPAAVVIELHEEPGVSPSKIDALVQSCSTNFECSLLTTAGRDLSGYPELSNWPDDDRWALCSESRAYQMRWLTLSPISHS